MRAKGLAQEHFGQSLSRFSWQRQLHLKILQSRGSWSLHVKRFFFLCHHKPCSLSHIKAHLASFMDIISKHDALNTNTLIIEDLCCILLMYMSPTYSIFRDILFYDTKKLSLETKCEALSSKESTSKFATKFRFNYNQGFGGQRMWPREEEISKFWETLQLFQEEGNYQGRMLQIT